MRRRRVVLLFHPDDASRVTFQVVLKREGYEVLEAGSLAEALEQVGEMVPDLLIAEVRPPRKIGLELIRTLRSQERYEAVRILAISSKATSTAPAGVDAFHAGPLTPEQLVKHVIAHIGRA